MKVLNILLLGLFVFNISASNVYYVSPDGNDSKCGSFENPFKTINYAISILLPGDSLLSRGGD